jgi:predicted short-subunit dehydrogenase-like oxidoreductase (DUF2520 family)
MTKPLNIFIIGSGNVACHIALSFNKKKEVKISGIFNHRKTKQATEFANQNSVGLTTDYKNIADADVYFICVKDEAIVEVVKNLSLLNLKGLVVHTSGSMNISVLKNVSSNTGVYYPLQSFSKNDTVDWQTTPVLIEASSQASLIVLNSLAGLVSDTVKKVNSPKRLQLHLAAVFACNFTNALYASAFELVDENLMKKDVNLLQPIMLQSFTKLQKMSPKHAQTGPAMRSDNVVMKRHLELLKTNKELTAVYKLLSRLIINQQSSKK